MSDILKKPVHKALIPITHIDALRKNRNLVDTQGVNSERGYDHLPQEEKEKQQLIPKVQVKLPISPKKRVSLKLLYDQTPPLPKDKIPPCNTCVAACCRVFIVDLLKEEFESGIFDPYVIHVTENTAKQLQSSNMLFEQIGPTLGPMTYTQGKDRYLLEGQVGEPCKFLTPNNQCGIYEERPIVCRTYTCIGDNRITDEHRNGTHTSFDNFK